MKLTDLEREQWAHLNTRKALLDAQTSALNRDADAWSFAVAARLGVKTPLTLNQDGTVSGAETE